MTLTVSPWMVWGGMTSGRRSYEPNVEKLSAQPAGASGRRDLECGCAYIKVRPGWWHVVGCPDHEMEFGPVKDPAILERLNG